MWLNRSNKIKISKKLINNQIDRLEENDIDDMIWLNKTRSIIINSFGENSSEASFINSFHFKKRGSPYWGEPEISAIPGAKAQVKRFLTECLETIDSHRSIKQVSVNQNILQKMSDTAVWSLISVALVGLPSMGYMAGNYVSDLKNVELRQELKNLQDSLSKTKLIPQTLWKAPVGSKPAEKELIRDKSAKSNLPR